MTKKLDLLLIHPGSRLKLYQSLGSSLAAIEPPIWAGLMATFARKHGLSVSILDANAEGLAPEEVAERVAEASPLLAVVVAYGQNPCASTQVMPAVGAICTSIKQTCPELSLLIVGGHVAALPERTLQEEAADFVCTGEGPQTIVDLVEELKAGVQPDYGRVPGLLYRDNGELKATSPAPFVQDLDGEMPGIAWDLLPMSKYRAHNWHCFGRLDRRQPYASLYTTLGCPYHCDFCCIQAPFRSGEGAGDQQGGRNSYRYWSPSSVLAQIDTLVNEYGVRNIKIADEMFVLNRKHVAGICEGIIERGYDLNIWAYARVDTVGSSLIGKLKGAGVNWLCFGIESGSQRVRDDVHKGFESDKVYETVKAVRDAGINVIANFLFGLPEDDLESMQATLDMALELNCEFANFYCAMAYPGSRLYEIAIGQGWPVPKTWNGYSQHSVDSLPLPTKHLSGAEVLRFRDQAFNTYFGNPEYLDLIERKFGAETAQHVREMASHKLERKHV